MPNIKQLAAQTAHQLNRESTSILYEHFDHSSADTTGADNADGHSEDETASLVKGDANAASDHARPRRPSRVEQWSYPISKTLSPVFSGECATAGEHNRNGTDGSSTGTDGDAYINDMEITPENLEKHGPDAILQAAAANVNAEQDQSGTQDNMEKRPLSGRSPPLFDIPLELDDIFYAQLRVEMWDETRHEILGAATFAVRHMFEVDFGLEEFCHYRDLLHVSPDELASEENDANMDGTDLTACCGVGPTTPPVNSWASNVRSQFSHGIPVESLQAFICFKSPLTFSDMGKDSPIVPNRRC